MNRLSNFFILNFDDAVHSWRRYVCLCLLKDFTWPMEGFLLPYAPPVKKPSHKKAVTTGNSNLLKACRGLFILGGPRAVCRIVKNGGKKRRENLFLKTLATVFPTQLTALGSRGWGFLIHWALGSAELTQKHDIMQLLSSNLQGGGSEVSSLPCVKT